MQIYIAEGTQQTGPFDLDTIKAGLRAGKYAATQLAWYEGAPGWEPISKLPGMEAAVAPPPPPPAPPAPPPFPSAETIPYPPAPPPPAYPSGSATPGPYAAPPPPFVPVPSAPYVPGPGGGPPKKGILATVGTIFVAVIAGLLGIARVTRPFWSHSSSSYSHTYASTPTPSVAPPFPSFNGAAPTPEKGTKHFVTKRSNYTGKLAEHYVAFSFDYPETWAISEEGPEDFYIEVEQRIRRPDGKTVAGEFATFNYAFNKPGYPLDKYLYATGPQLLDMLSESLAKQYPQNTKTRPKTSAFGRSPAQEQCVTAPADNNQTTYLRLFIVANVGSDSVNGLSVDLYGSDGAGTKSADSLGKSGGLKTIADSFHFEK